MAKRKSKEPVLDTFMLAFFGQYVTVMCQIATDKGELYTEQSGFILDRDDEYLYLGKSSEEIDFCIKRDKIMVVESKEKKDVIQEYLNNMPIPDKEVDVN